MKRSLVLSLVVLLVPALVFADAGVLIPRDKQQPNPAILSLEEMEITVRIDNGDARVFVRQVFANHTAAIEEGNYVFALPSHATIPNRTLCPRESPAARLLRCISPTHRRSTSLRHRVGGG